MSVVQQLKPCPVCNGENGKHQKIAIPYPWPFNKAAFKTLPCPNE